MRQYRSCLSVKGIGMIALVEKIVSLENEAESIVARAHEEAKRLEKDSEEETASYRRKLADEMEQRIAAFSSEREKMHQTAMTGAEGELKAALDAVDQIPPNILQDKVELIMSRLGSP
jgi:vacuolar-type H+-ATPase subunit E/Vma4